jgi:hypothetical protein
MSSNPLCGGNSVHWPYKLERSLGSGLSTKVNPYVINACLTCGTLSIRCAAWHVTGRLTCLMLNCIMLAVFFVIGRLTFQMPLLYTQVQYHCGTRGSYVVKPNKTQTSLRLASLLGRASSSRSGGHEFEFPVWRELSVLTKVGRSLESGLSTVVNPNMIKSCQTCSTLSVRQAA